MKLLTEHVKAILGVLVIVASFAYFFVTYFVGKSQSDPQIIIAIVGAMTTVLAYYFGNSQGAAKKDETIAALSNNPTVTNADTVNVRK